jgi:hypothetical protein
MSMDSTDFENADLIPDGTIGRVLMKIRFGEGAENVLTRSKNGTSEMLKVEYTLLEGLYAKRKFWQDHLLIGSTDGQKSMVDKNKGVLKSIIDSAKGLDPADKGPEARQARTLQYRDFDGLQPQVKIAIEPARTSKDTGQTFGARNVVDKAIVRGDPEWREPSAGGVPPAPSAGSPPAPASAPATVTPIAKPKWATT